MKRLVIILAVLVLHSGLFSVSFAEKTQSSDTTTKTAESTPDANHLPDPNSTSPAPGKPAETENSQMKAKPAEDPNNPLVAINLNNIEMKSLLAKLAAWTGKVIIPSDEAMKVKLTIFASKEVPKSEALSLIFDALRAKGIIAEISENKLFLKPLSEAKVGHIPVLAADEPLARIQDKSQMVEKYFKLKNASPLKIVNIITPLTASYGHVTAHESSRSIAVIDTVENLFRIKKTIAQFDVPESDQIAEEIFKIQNGDAVEIVQVFELIYQDKTNTRSRMDRRSGPPRRPAPGKNNIEPASSVSIDSGEVPIVLLPVPKHNWIIARASSDDMIKVKEWIERLDIAETSPQEKTFIKVKHVDPQEVVRFVRNTIQNMPGSELQTSVVVEAMSDSRQVVIFGSEENRKDVERLIMDIDLPAVDIYRNQDFKLEYADPDEVKTNLEGLYETEAGRFSTSSYNRGSYSSRYRQVDPKDVVKVTSFPTLKQISVIATEENLKKIEAQVKEWDVPMDLKKEQYLLITLKNSDPVQMVELLTTLFSQEDDNSSRSFIRMIIGGRDEADNKKKIVGSLYGLLTFEAVPGTKKILIISKVPEAYPVIKSLIEDLDSQEKGEVPIIMTLDYADPEELSDQLNAILNERGTNATIRRRQQGLSETDFNKTENSSSSSSNPQNQNDPGLIQPWWTSGRDNDTEMPLSNLIGKIRFIPVHRSKAILALAPPEYYKDIEKMVKKLDQPEMQVMLEAVIVEVDHSSMTSLGVQLSSNPTFFNAMGQNAIKGKTGLDFIKEISKGMTLSAGTNIDVIIDLLAKTVNAKVLNQPNLWTKDNEEAIFFKGKKISILKSNQTSPTGSISNNYDQEPVGVTLKVRPNITPAKDVDVTINLEISDLAAEFVNNQPVINRLNTSTNLIVADGETIMLGGILFQSESKIKSKVPVIGDIPVIGSAFSHSDVTLKNSELLVFLTPHVIVGKETRKPSKYIVPPQNNEQLPQPPAKEYKENAPESEYISKPAKRMKDIKRNLNRTLSNGVMSISP